MKRVIAVALAGLMMAGCTEEGAADEQTAVDPEREAASAEGGDRGLVPDTTAGNDAIEVVSAGDDIRFDPACRITESGVAGIEMPETLGEFVGAFPADTALSFYPTYMVDFGKLCLRAGGEDALCADFESYDVEAYDPDIAVVGLSVYAPQCRTAEGIGPGSSVAETIEAYGAPTFAFNHDNESREYASFADEPANLAFRAESRSAEADTSSPGVPSGSYAGDYSGAGNEGPYFETPDYYPDGVIREIFIMPPFEPIE